MLIHVSGPEKQVERETRVPVAAPRSAVFFVAILFGPAALVAPFLNPRSLWTWVITAIGLGTVARCIWLARQAFFTTPDGIVRRRWLMGRDTVMWNEVEAVGTDVIQGKYGAEQALLFVYTAAKRFHISMRVSDVGTVTELLTEKCPRALWIDEGMGTFQVPVHGDAEQVRELVQRHTRRLRRKHAWISLIWAMVFVPSISYLLLYGKLGWNMMTSIGMCLAFFAAMSWRSWTALWRLGK